MAFNMKGSPAKMGRIQGTAGHASALKMKAEADAASALKQAEERETSWWRGEEGLIPDEFQKNVNRPKVKTEHGKNVEAEKEAEKTKTTKKDIGKKGLYKSDKSWKEGQETAKTKGYDLDALTKKRKGLEKGSDDWKRNQNKINEALGNKKRYDVADADATNTTTKNKPKNRIEKVVNKGEIKKERIADKAAKLTGEVKENVDKKTARLTRKGARKEFGKGSKEHLAAKQAHLVAKEADRQGEKGGRKQGIFRKWSSSINKTRQKKNQAKIDAANAEENA
jgi:hypothetical protein